VNSMAVGKRKKESIPESVQSHCSRKDIPETVNGVDETGENSVSLYKERSLKGGKGMYFVRLGGNGNRCRDW